MDRRSRLRSAHWLAALAMLLAAAVTCAQPVTPDPLPSWNDGAAKSAIVAFVTGITTPGGEHYVAPGERVAVFDNDGTLWSEHPVYVQLAFTLDRIRSLAPQHPEWKTTQPFKAVLDGDSAALAALHEKDLVELVMAAHANTTSEEFVRIVNEWLATAIHPRFKRPYTELVYQPMLEMLAYLRANGIKTFIVSGGGVEFMRPWAERVYGIPPEQVVGSSIALKYEVRSGVPTLQREARLNFLDDKAGKPIAIQYQIGRRPTMAFGNSDGDFQMLEWTTAGSGARLGIIVHHTDAEREYAYDRKTSFGRLDKALDAAAPRGWIVVDMQHDWKTVFPPVTSAGDTRRLH